jgi:hypothetical protein
VVLAPAEAHRAVCAVGQPAQHIASLCVWRHCVAGAALVADCAAVLRDGQAAQCACLIFAGLLQGDFDPPTEVALLAPALALQEWRSRVVGNMQVQ